MEVPEVVDVLDVLTDKAAKWYMIGVKLRLSKDELDIIKADSKGVQECLTRMIDKWHANTEPHPTWKAVIDALNSRLVDEPGLALQLKERFGVLSPQSSVKQAQLAGIHVTSSTTSKCMQV